MSAETNTRAELHSLVEEWLNAFSRSFTNDSFSKRDALAALGCFGCSHSASGQSPPGRPSGERPCGSCVRSPGVQRNGPFKIHEGGCPANPFFDATEAADAARRLGQLEAPPPVCNCTPKYLSPLYNEDPRAEAKVFDNYRTPDMRGLLQTMYEGGMQVQSKQLLEKLAVFLGKEFGAEMLKQLLASDTVRRIVDPDAEDLQAP